MSRRETDLAYRLNKWWRTPPTACKASKGQHVPGSAFTKPRKAKSPGFLAEVGVEVFKRQSWRYRIHRRLKRRVYAGSHF
jgi:hypothetical protein